MIPFRRPQRAPRLPQLVHFGGDAVEPLGELVELVDADVQPVEVGADDAADELFEAHACCIDYRPHRAESGGLRSTAKRTNGPTSPTRRATAGVDLRPGSSTSRACAP